LKNKEITMEVFLTILNYIFLNIFNFIIFDKIKWNEKNNILYKKKIIWLYILDNLILGIILFIIYIIKRDLIDMFNISILYFLGLILFKNMTENIIENVKKEILKNYIFGIIVVLFLIEKIYEYYLK
jgi:hypothetical protein